MLSSTFLYSTSYHQHSCGHGLGPWYTVNPYTDRQRSTRIQRRSLFGTQIARCSWLSTQVRESPDSILDRSDGSDSTCNASLKAMPLSSHARSKVRVSTGALLFLIEVSGLCTCSPSSGFLWNGTGENWKRKKLLCLLSKAIHGVLRVQSLQLMGTPTH